LAKWILITGGILAGAALLMGAFAGHALKGILEPKAMGWIETGVFYQSTHALALLACGLLPAAKSINRTAILFTAGILLFSGSLYLMGLTGITKLGVITPIGGVCLIAGWVSFCMAVWSLDNKP